MAEEDEEGWNADDSDPSRVRVERPIREALIELEGEEPVPFVQLHVHSEYSLLDGASRVPELVSQAKAFGMPALAVTDHGTLSGMVELCQYAAKAGIQAIPGAEFYMAAGGDRFNPTKVLQADGGTAYYNHLVVLAKNQKGWENLMQLASRSSLESFYNRWPLIDHALLEEHREGLMVTSACLGGELAQAILMGDSEGVEQTIGWYREVFGDDYYLEMHNHGIPEEDVVRHEIARLSRRYDIPIVAAGDSHYTHANEAKAHEILIGMQTQASYNDPTRWVFSGSGYHFKSGREMMVEFAEYPEAVSNTVFVAQKCDFKLELGTIRLPQFGGIPSEHSDVSYLRQLCEEGMRARLGEDGISEEYQARLDKELGVIDRMGFSSYFLITADICREARARGVKVGPGRGSAAGSFVAYVLRITNVDPVKYGILFERFLNEDRKEMPDIDLDFDDHGRGQMIKYAQEKYGVEQVAQVITFGTLGARESIKSVGRVFSALKAEGKTGRIKAIRQASINRLEEEYKGPKMVLEQENELRKMLARLTVRNQQAEESLRLNQTELEYLGKRLCQEKIGITGPELNGLKFSEMAALVRTLPRPEVEAGAVYTEMEMKADIGKALRNALTPIIAEENAKASKAPRVVRGKSVEADPESVLPAVLKPAEEMRLAILISEGLLGDGYPEVALPDIVKLSALVPGVPGMTLAVAMESSPELRKMYETEDWAKKVLDFAMLLEGLSRNASTHAAAVVIAAQPLTQLVPVQRPTGKSGNSDVMVTQVDMKAVSALGLLKMDFLGLANLTAIADALHNIEVVQGKKIDLDEVRLDDPATFALLQKADTYGIFQLEAPGAQGILVEMVPRNLDDLGVSVALNRPGPLQEGIPAKYMSARSGRTPVYYPSKEINIPELKNLLDPTFGLIVYQDQVMKVAQQVAGYTLGEADILRGAMGKKDLAKMAHEKPKFLAGMAAAGYSQEQADLLYATLAAFAKYGFGHAHALSYAVLSYQNSYLKANYPREYLAAYLNTKAGKGTADDPKVVAGFADCRGHGLKILAPDINRSETGFTPIPDDDVSILYGLEHIKSIGQAGVEIYAARQKDGEFANLLDLMVRVPAVSKAAAGVLIKTGACDALGERAALLASVDACDKRARAIVEERALTVMVKTEREKGGAYVDLVELVRRNPSITQVGLTRLIRAGELTELGTEESLQPLASKAWRRGRLLAKTEAEAAVSAGLGSGPAKESLAVRREVGAYPVTEPFELEYVAPAIKPEKLEWEKEFLHTYVSGHPLDDKTEILRQRTTHALMDVGPQVDWKETKKEVQVGGILRKVKVFVPKSQGPDGEKMAAVELEDLTGSVKALAFKDTYKTFQELIKPGASVIIRGRAEIDEPMGGGTAEVELDENGEAVEQRQPMKILISSVWGIDDPKAAELPRARGERGQGPRPAWTPRPIDQAPIPEPKISSRSDKCLYLEMPQEEAAQKTVLAGLRKLIGAHPGDVPVVLKVPQEGKVLEVALAVENYGVSFDSGFSLEVENLLGPGTYALKTPIKPVPATRRSEPVRVGGAGGAASTPFAVTASPEDRSL